MDFQASQPNRSQRKLFSIRLCPHSHPSFRVKCVDDDTVFENIVHQEEGEELIRFLLREINTLIQFHGYNLFFLDTRNQSISGE